MPLENGLDYLRQVLTLDPAIDAGRITALRTVYLGLQRDVTPLSDADALISYRRHFVDRLECLRSEFWDLNLAELTRRLHEIDVRTFPELSPDVTRLLRVAAQRPAIERLAALGGDESEFVELLRRIVTASPLDAGRLRNASLTALRDAPRGRRDPRVRAALAVARRIVDDHPEVRSIEEDWLAAVLHVGARPGRWRSEAPWLMMTLTVPIAIYLIFMLVIYRVLR